MNAEECKLRGNKAAGENNWTAALKWYTEGLARVKEDKDLKVILLSNRSLANLNLGCLHDALLDAEKVVSTDETFEKGYLRLAAALEALNFKSATKDNSVGCPVMMCYRTGLNMIPGSVLLQTAMVKSFPWMASSPLPSLSTESLNAKMLTSSLIAPALSVKDAVGGAGAGAGAGGATAGKSTASTKAGKKPSLPTKAQRALCVPVDIRGALGPHELRINGVYAPSEEISGGWPIYKKRVEDLDDSDADEDDNLILEYNGNMHEWMIKHASMKGTHRSFVYYKCLTLHRPEQCLGPWNTLEDKKPVNQPEMSVKSEEERRQEDLEHFQANRSSCTVIEVRGATGRKSNGINGIYSPTDISFGGWPIYKKDVVDSDDPQSKTNSGCPIPDQQVWMEFNPYFKSWQIKPTSCLNTNRSWAYVVSSTKGQRPDLCPFVWEVLEDDDFAAQESINVMTIDQWKQDDALSVACWSEAKSLDVRGAKGPYATAINGVYDPEDDFDHGYRKRTELSCVIEYNRKKKIWQMRSVLGAYAYALDDDRVPLHKCSSEWNVLVSGCCWEVQSTISVMTIEERRRIDTELYGDKLSEAVPLDVRGATGVNSFKINGVYEPIYEIACGWPVYQRRGSNDYWLEYNSDRGNWQIKSAANRGMDSAFAYVDSVPACRPEHCQGPWCVYTGNKNGDMSNGWEVQHSVTVLTVDQRHEEDMKLFAIRAPECISVDIRGALGPRSGGLTGIFDPTDEMHGGWPVYRKRDDTDWFLEYDACPQKWMVRPTPCRGTTRGRAYILCEPNLRPEQAKGLWRMSDGKGGWAIEPAIFVRPLCEAIEEDRVNFAARRSTAVTIDLRGVARPMSYLNGVYEPTFEACSGWPVYKKKSSDNQWLEYHSASKEWQLKPTCCKGTKKNWAYISSDPTHPELCTGSSWMVLESGKHVRQDSVSLVALDQRVRDDRTLADTRRSTCSSVVIFGATGPHADCINGLYEPSATKCCGGWPSFIRTCEFSRSMLEFNVYAMSWTVTSLKLLSSGGAGGSAKPCALCAEVARQESAEASSAAASSNASDTSSVSSQSSAGGDAQSTDGGTSTSISVTKCKHTYQVAAGSSCSTGAPGTATADIGSQLVAFVEVSKSLRPELCKEASSVWKVLIGERFEVQDAVGVVLAQSYSQNKDMERMTASTSVVALSHSQSDVSSEVVAVEGKSKKKRNKNKTGALAAPTASTIAAAGAAPARSSTMPPTATSSVGEAADAVKTDGVNDGLPSVSRSRGKTLEDQKSSVVSKVQKGSLSLSSAAVEPVVTAPPPVEEWTEVGIRKLKSQKPSQSSSSNTAILSSGAVVSSSSSVGSRITMSPSLAHLSRVSDDNMRVPVLTIPPLANNESVSTNVWDSKSSVAEKLSQKRTEAVPAPVVSTPAPESHATSWAEVGKKNKGVGAAKAGTSTVSPPVSQVKSAGGKDSKPTAAAVAVNGVIGRPRGDSEGNLRASAVTVNPSPVSTPATAPSGSASRSHPAKKSSPQLSAAPSAAANIVDRSDSTIVESRAAAGEPVSYSKTVRGSTGAKTTTSDNIDKSVTGFASMSMQSDDLGAEGLVGGIGGLTSVDHRQSMYGLSESWAESDSLVDLAMLVSGAGGVGGGISVGGINSSLSNDHSSSQSRGSRSSSWLGLIEEDDDIFAALRSAHNANLDFPVNLLSHQADHLSQQGYLPGVMSDLKDDFDLQSSSQSGRSSSAAGLYHTTDPRPDLAPVLDSPFESLISAGSGSGYGPAGGSDFGSSLGNPVSAFDSLISSTIDSISLSSVGSLSISASNQNRSARLSPPPPPPPPLTLPLEVFRDAKLLSPAGGSSTSSISRLDALTAKTAGTATPLDSLGSSLSGRQSFTLGSSLLPPTPPGPMTTSSQLTSGGNFQSAEPLQLKPADVRKFDAIFQFPPLSGRGSDKPSPSSSSSSSSSAIGVSISVGGDVTADASLGGRAIVKKDGVVSFAAVFMGQSVWVRRPEYSESGEGLSIANTPKPSAEAFRKNQSRRNAEFLREIQVLCSCRHHCIVPLIAHSVRPCLLVFPSFATRTVRHVLAGSDARSRFPPAARLHCVIDVCSALSFLHQQPDVLGCFPIAHRAINADAVIVGSEGGSSMLSGFATSRDMDAEWDGQACSDDRFDGELISNHRGFCDPQYLHSRLFTAAADRFSLGSLFLLLLFAELSDCDLLLNSIVNRISSTAPSQSSSQSSSSSSFSLSPCGLNDSEVDGVVYAGVWPRPVVVAVGRLVLRCQCPSPSGGGGGGIGRYQSCSELKQQLEQILDMCA